MSGQRIADTQRRNGEEAALRSPVMAVIASWMQGEPESAIMRGPLWVSASSRDRGE